MVFGPNSSTMCQECLTQHTATPQRLRRTGLARDITTHVVLRMYPCTKGQVWGTDLRGWYVELIRHHSTPCLLCLVVAIVAPLLCLCEFNPQRRGVSELYRIVFTKEYSLRWLPPSIRKTTFRSSMPRATLVEVPTCRHSWKNSSRKYPSDSAPGPYHPRPDHYCSAGLSPHSPYRHPLLVASGKRRFSSQYVPRRRFPARCQGPGCQSCSSGGCACKSRLLMSCSLELCSRGVGGRGWRRILWRRNFRCRSI